MLFPPSGKYRDYLLTLIFVDYCGIISLRQCVASINSFMFILSE
ncbi:Uncharacterised protein [Serratia marcescens]|nr:hypothetical protein AZZ98_004577 [Serratia marcescens]CAI1719913.1 Uncharacterised protein [Serratia marcescens]CAI1879204.1 Uncharacterised protein [Serratia marcescens]CAI2025433.1 Uncharacterised protein [Serratia marcescens]CUZ45816.1 Uncharacterised protein [Serratia marcescens]